MTTMRFRMIVACAVLLAAAAMAHVAHARDAAPAAVSAAAAAAPNGNYWQCTAVVKKSAPKKCNHTLTAEGYVENCPHGAKELATARAIENLQKKFEDHAMCDAYAWVPADGCTTTCP
jgi:hypothetical protein